MVTLQDTQTTGRISIQIQTFLSGSSSLFLHLPAMASQVAENELIKSLGLSGITILASKWHFLKEGRLLDCKRVYKAGFFYSLFLSSVRHTT